MEPPSQPASHVTRATAFCIGELAASSAERDQPAKHARYRAHLRLPFRVWGARKLTEEARSLRCTASHVISLCMDTGGSLQPPRERATLWARASKQQPQCDERHSSPGLQTRTYKVRADALALDIGQTSVSSQPPSTSPSRRPPMLWLSVLPALLALFSLARTATSACSGSLGSGTAAPGDPFWMQSIAHQGVAPLSGQSGYTVFRNVKDFGAKG
jgi:hypothetical protein